MKSAIMHLGIDVAKEKLDVYNPASDTVVTVKNDPLGYRYIRDIARKNKAIVCCEPTGGQEINMIIFLQRSKVPVAYCDGYRVRHYAHASGQLSKNDPIDARIISSFADAIGVRVLNEKDKTQMELRSVFNLYKAYMEMHKMFLNKVTTYDKDMNALLKSEAKRFKDKAVKVLAKCIELINEDSRMKYLLERFMEIDGIGSVTAICIIAELPEIGTMSDSAIAKLVGLAPLEHQSGKMDKTRHIFGGRKSVRCSLYMATVASVKFNHILSAYYSQIRARAPGKKAGKWALVPVMRKLLILMNRLAKDPSFELQKKPRIKAA